jgi:hypothetical protein
MDGVGGRPGGQAACITSIHPWMPVFFIVPPRVRCRSAPLVSAPGRALPRIAGAARAGKNPATRDTNRLMIMTRHRTALPPLGRDVIDWRQERLQAHGFRPTTARRLARDPRFDLHALIELIERGCTHKLAVRILAPDDR